MGGRRAEDREDARRWRAQQVLSAWGGEGSCEAQAQGGRVRAAFQEYLSEHVVLGLSSTRELGALERVVDILRG